MPCLSVDAIVERRDVSVRKCVHGNGMVIKSMTSAVLELMLRLLLIPAVVMIMDAHGCNAAMLGPSVAMPRYGTWVADAVEGSFRTTVD